MASLVVHVSAAAASLPSARARRISAGRLTLAAVPGHGAAVFAGRRVGSGGHGGVLIAVSSTMKAPREVKAACVPGGGDNSSLGPEYDDEGYLSIRSLLVVGEDESDPDHMIDEDVFDRFYRVLGEKIDARFSGLNLKPLAVSDEDRAVQEKFKETANKYIELVVDATRRTRPVEKMRKLHTMLGDVYPWFATARLFAKARCVNWRMALHIVEKLLVLRKVVSTACGTPLPVPVNREQMLFDRKVALTLLDTEALAGHGVESNLSVVIFVLIDSVYNTVKSDIDDMISASSTP